MPGSKKVLANRVRQENKANGVGDENGRMPARVKTDLGMARCAKCFQEIRVTKSNSDIIAHASSKHGTFPFAECFPGLTV